MSKKFLFFLIMILLVFAAVSSYANDQNGDSNDKGKPQAKEPVYPPYTGPKKRIAVTKFDNKVQGSYGNWNIGDGMSEMLTTELIKTGRFVVIERQALQDVVDEQKLGQSGLVQKETAAKIGQLLGAQIVIRGVVSEFEQTESGGGKGISLFGVSLASKQSNAHVAVDIRMIDTVTGQVLYSHNAAGKAESSGVSVGVAVQGMSFGADDFKKTPIGQATRQAIHDAVKFIMDTMEKVPFSAKVIKFDGSKAYINAGASMNIKPGIKFNAYSVGEEIVDPDTGLKLGSEEKLVGVIEVREVQDKFSTGVAAPGCGKLKKGDVLRLQE